MLRRFFDLTENITDKTVALNFYGNVLKYRLLSTVTIVDSSVESLDPSLALEAVFLYSKINFVLAFTKKKLFWATNSINFF